MRPWPLLIIALIVGCAESRAIHETCRVTFELHVVGDRSQFDWPEAQKYGGPAGRTIGAYASSGNPHKIWIRGYRDRKGVHVDNNTMLGHEVEEVLHMTCPEFQNPH